MLLRHCCWCGPGFRVQGSGSGELLDGRNSEYESWRGAVVMTCGIAAVSSSGASGSPSTACSSKSLMLRRYCDSALNQYCPASFIILIVGDSITSVTASNAHRLLNISRESVYTTLWSEKCHLKPGPHQQQCRSNIVECYNVEFCFDKVDRCFDIVAQNGNIVKATGNKVACCFDNVASTLLLVWTVDRALCFRARLLVWMKSKLATQHAWQNKDSDYISIVLLVLSRFWTFDEFGKKQNPLIKNSCFRRGNAFSDNWTTDVSSCMYSLITTNEMIDKAN